MNYPLRGYFCVNPLQIIGDFGIPLVCRELDGNEIERQIYRKL